MNHIELFAGCGGLSLGLETNGFELLLANELSPMAAETFAYNHLGVDLTDPSCQKSEFKVYWISSSHPRDEMKKRLRENPNDAAGLKGKTSDVLDLASPRESLERSLLVGSIIDLNQLLARRKDLHEALRDGFGRGGVDVVSGGPPCQSFSMAGLRQHGNQRNMLPWEFAKFVNKVRPKIALLENVTGILRAFNVDGHRKLAWVEVAKAFSKNGYVPICLHVNAKYVGTAQNRPRFIMIALRDDIADKVLESNNDPFLKKVTVQAVTFKNLIQQGLRPKTSQLMCYDVEDFWQEFSDSAVFSPLASHGANDLVSVKEALDDLRSKKVARSKYVQHINTVFFNPLDRPLRRNFNHAHRLNNPRVRARFYLYQLLAQLHNGDRRSLLTYLRTLDDNCLIDSVVSKMLVFSYLLPDGSSVNFKTADELKEHLKILHTKKQTQRALVADQPAPAALSIPDDACHYHPAEIRTLTVREMARIQSFPDWFVFRSKVTTGGQMRRFEVPQYTQVGNAVPPLLGLALGNVCKALLQQVEI